MRSALRKFIQHESASAWLLLTATLLALFLSNSPWHTNYETLLHISLTLPIHSFTLKLSFLHLTNEGLMTLFFLVVSLEIKYELLFGTLNSPAKACLPAIAAAGGMCVPALIYVLINYGNAISLQGWAIPTATDIAFSLGVLTLLGSRVSSTLKIFLMALAIFDDLAAIIIIAVFYTAHLSYIFLGITAACIVLLAILNTFKVKRLSIYVPLGIALWYCLLKSGVHPTLAGAALAFFIPFRTSTANVTASPAYTLKHRLHPWVAFGVLPLFAFANAGIALLSVSLNNLEPRLITGVLLGLLLGKPLGIFGSVYLASKLGVARLPNNSRYREFFALSFLCGIGFTVSLFIGTLAFGDSSNHLDAVKIGVISGSLLSGLMGYALLRRH